MSRPRLFVSFSGGKTSAYMAKQLLERGWGERFEIRFGFANTGCEWEQTLEFVERCDKTWGLNVAWVEADVQHGKREGSKHRLVNFGSASRKGEPFEEVIKKYGIPNKAFPHCTRELKVKPLRSWLESIGWDEGTYYKAIGIRADEPKRFRLDGPDEGIIYPLAQFFPTTKPEINDWWDEQSFNLQLQEHQGNCSWCWKKSLRKHIKIAQETPEVFEFPLVMEATYPRLGPEFKKADGDTRPDRTFFRGNTSAQQLLQIAESSADIKIPPDDPDFFSGCSESCEVFQ